MIWKVQDARHKQPVACRMRALMNCAEVNFDEGGMCLPTAPGLPIEGNGDFGVVAEFDDEAGWLVYQQDEEHRRVIEQLIVPVTAERLAVQLRHP